MIGKTLNHYKVLEKLGAGGMGEVYVAEDPRLNRKVALKILPSGTAESPERLERFDREAKAVAALNHPNIVTIYSIEESDAGDGGRVNFLTMELVRGCTLGQVIPRGGMPLRRLLEVALALSDAVGAAHEQGIVHRDLKPANVMVGDDGRVKILDFGLAKLTEPTGPGAGDTEAPTRPFVTEEGRILGTVAYMSPEQAEGKRVDARSDIFSLGVMLHEMATGSLPFKGGTRASLISSILRDTPPSVTGLNEALPRHLGRIVKRCLAKDPKRRYGNGGELHNELLELKEEIDSGEVEPGAAPGRPSRRGVPGLYVVGGILLVAIAAAGYLVLDARRSAAARGAGAAPVQAAVTQITDLPGTENIPAISPDGRTVLFASAAAGSWDIYLQRVEGERLLNLTEGSGVDNWAPAWSPDGETIAFNSDRDGGGIFRMGGTGESVRRLTAEGFDPAWSPDGADVAYATMGFRDPQVRKPGSELWVVHLESGEKRKVREPDAMQPAWSPHGRRIAYWGLRPGSGQRDIWTIPAAGGETVSVTDDIPTDWNPVWSPDGRSLYFASDRGGTMNIWRVPIEEESGRVLGPAQPVTSSTSSAGRFSISSSGNRIAYTVGSRTTNIQRVPFDPGRGVIAGEPEWVTRGSSSHWSPSVSPDGKWITYIRWGAQEDVFVMRTDGTGRRQLTDDPHKDRVPAWSSDGSRIAFHSDRSGVWEIWTIRPDGSDLRQVTGIPGKRAISPTWSPDGARILANFGGRAAYFDPRLPPAELELQFLPEWPEGGGRTFQPYGWSPDGKSIAGPAWTSNGDFDGFGIYSLEGGRFSRLTPPDDRLRESEIFGPLWLRDGRRLMFSADYRLYLLDSESGEYREIYSAEPDFIELTSLADGDRTIYLNRGTFESDIWLLELR